MNIEKVFRDIAIGIDTTMCPDTCPCLDGCNAIDDEECHDRIVDWLKKMMRTKPVEED